MEIKDKLNALERLFDLYDQYSQQLPVACRKHCAHCCTCNVTLTSIEARHIIKALRPERRADLEHNLSPQLDRQRFQPQITLNHLAQGYLNKQEPPEEPIDADWGPCPLLENNACPIYEVRPFGCRCLLSRQDCGISGYAEIDAYTITVNYVFSQFIEHLDHDGISGNFSDVLLCLDWENDNAKPPLNTGDPRCHVIANRPIPLLLIPPEHQGEITALVNQLHAIVTAQPETSQ